jgi:hypothetical protein
MSVEFLNFNKNTIKITIYKNFIKKYFEIENKEIEKELIIYLKIIN